MLHIFRNCLFCLSVFLLVFCSATNAFAGSAEQSSSIIPESVISSVSPRYPDCCVIGSTIYYCSEDGIVRCEADGSCAEVITPMVGFVFTNGKDLFCGTDRRILRLDSDGSEKLLLKVSPLVNEGYFKVMNALSCFTAEDDQIYYVLTLYENHTLRAIAMDGSNDRGLGDICCVTNDIDEVVLSPDGDEITVYFHSADGTTGSTTMSLAEQ